MIADMALGENRMFQWKSKAQLKEEDEKFAKWAFPYGKRQRDNLEALMLQLRPKEKLQFKMMGYLTCKELYEKHLANSGSSASAIDILINVEKKYMQIIKKDDMSTYLALVLADAEIDEKSEYPTADEIRGRIAELEKLRVRKKLS